jgi:hypothetical protein
MAIELETWKAIWELIMSSYAQAGWSRLAATGLIISSQSLVASVATALNHRPRHTVSPHVVQVRPQISLGAFLAKWNVPGIDGRSEEAIRTEFLLNLLNVLGIQEPIAADPEGLNVAFERRVVLPDGTSGFIDLLIGPCAIEAKRPGTSLQAALIQLRGYSVALPQLSTLIVTNFRTLDIYPVTPLSPDVPAYHYTLDSLDRHALKVLRLAFTDPDRLFHRRRRFLPRRPGVAGTTSHNAEPRRHVPSARRPSRQHQSKKRNAS